jgi:hypothetical protein
VALWFAIHTSAPAWLDVRLLPHFDVMSNMPSFEDARRMIRDLSLPWKQHVEAAGVITSSKEASNDDLLACLRIRGLPSEWAACALYVRTRRPRKDDTVFSVVLDHDDWQRYLSEHEPAA